MRKDDRARQLPEITRYTKYYEHDGMLRAYANRSMLLAMIFGVLAMASLGFAVYVRVQPPTVIRVDKDGNAFAVVGPVIREGGERSICRPTHLPQIRLPVLRLPISKAGPSCASFSPAILPTRRTRWIETWPRL